MKLSEQLSVFTEQLLITETSEPDHLIRAVTEKHQSNITLVISLYYYFILCLYFAVLLCKCHVCVCFSILLIY